MMWHIILHNLPNSTILCFIATISSYEPDPSPRDHSTCAASELSISVVALKIKLMCFEPICFFALSFTNFRDRSSRRVFIEAATQIFAKVSNFPSLRPNK